MKKRILIIALCILLGMALLLGGIWIYAQRTKHDLTLSRFALPTPKLTQSLRIVQLSDLHNEEFGPGNAELVSLVEAQKPDLILLTGDLVTQDEEPTAVATALIRSLAEIAPVCASLGNHELGHQERFGTDLSALYASAGAAVLEQTFLDLELKGQKIRLGGLFGYCLPEIYLASGEAQADECAFLNAFQDTQRLKLLLCHMPVCWMINGSLDAWEADVVFAGHTHGGQIILPFAGGVYGPDLGFFPGDLEGLYFSENHAKTLVLTRGLSSSIGIPRINNLPEVVVVDLIPEKE